MFTRPTRFGKTLNMSMLQYFFEDAREEDGNKRETASLFDGLDIMKIQIVKTISIIPVSERKE